MKMIIPAGLIFALCIAVVPVSAELTSDGGGVLSPPITFSISSQTAKPTDVITLSAVVDNSQPCPEGSAFAHYKMEKDGENTQPPWIEMEVTDTTGSQITFTATIDLGPLSPSPGIYLISMNGAPACTYPSEDPMVFTLVIYDPDGGFVTGGGWIDSPEGAYAADPVLAGRANFGFVSKYLKGATVPTGQTQFQFRVGNLNFHSSSYDWLVVAGAKAQYKGTGTINNEGSFRFMLTAVDGQLPGGGGTDRFRIRIWENVEDEFGNEIESPVYDNQLGDPDSTDPTTAIAGGSIVIHKH